MGFLKIAYAITNRIRGDSPYSKIEAIDDHSTNRIRGDSPRDNQTSCVVRSTNRIRGDSHGK